MKQLQFTFRDDDALSAELGRLRQWVLDHPSSKALVQIYTEILDRARIERVCAMIREALPDADIAGCSSNGNIVNGDFSGGSMAVICTLFEDPSTKVEVLQYPLTGENQAEVTADLKKVVAERDWVKGVELLVNIRGMSMTDFCQGLSELPEGIQVFGGGAFSEVNNSAACVFSTAGGYQEKSVVFVLYGGEALHIESSYVTGWKPLGSFLNVTAAQGSVLKELNHRPAYETYYKYLHIKNNKSFFYNTLEFPFLYRCNGIDIIRAPIASNPDGSLTMTSDISQNVKARIAYGDPWTILDEAWQEGNRLLKFSPDCVHVFSCAARRIFWGNLEVGKETEPYQLVAPTSGFYTSGEFLRTNSFVNQHNVTQVIAALREGAPRPQPERTLAMSSRGFEGKVSMIIRMATFIKATTEELEEANRKLSELAVTDALTGLWNKNAYFGCVKRLDEAIAWGQGRFAVCVFDLNGLKQINDNYSHECGDIAIADTAEALKGVFGAENLYRVGGDEYIAILPDADADEVRRNFAALDAAIEALNATEKVYRVPLALSKGFSVCDPDTDTQYRQVFRRADDAMYADKAEYYKHHDRRRR